MTGWTQHNCSTIIRQTDFVFSSSTQTTLFRCCLFERRSRPNSSTSLLGVQNSRQLLHYRGETGHCQQLHSDTDMPKQQYLAVPVR